MSLFGTSQDLKPSRNNRSQPVSSSIIINRRTRVSVSHYERDEMTAFHSTRFDSNRNRVWKGYECIVYREDTTIFQLSLLFINRFRYSAVSGMVCHSRESVGRSIYDTYDTCCSLNVSVSLGILYLATDDLFHLGNFLV